MKKEKCNLDKVKLGVAVWKPKARRDSLLRASAGGKSKRYARAKYLGNSCLRLKPGLHTQRSLALQPLPPQIDRNRRRRDEEREKARLEAACFGRFGVSSGWFSVIIGNRSRRGDFVRVDFGLADKGNAFFDHQLGGANITKQFGLGFDIDLILRDDISVDLAADSDGADVHIALDHSVVAEIEGAIGLDVTVQFSIEGKFAGKLEGAFEFDVRVEDVLGVGIRCCAHMLFEP